MKPRAFLLVAIAVLVTAQEPAAKLNLMPWPAEISVGQGSLGIGTSLSVERAGYSEPRLLDAIQRFGATLSSPAALVIQCDHASQPVQQLEEDESYHLEVTPKQAHLSAANPLGVLRGLETFRQLLVSTPQGFQIPVVDIHDHPRFPWRGLHLDVARHWMPVEVVKRNLDGMAAVKLNVFHWHLSDDQGFRVESKRFPKLQRLGSDGLYYTQDQVRDVIAYARDRCIRVVPEFDVPGHTTSWLVGYPQLASAPGPYRIEREWGVFDPTMDPTRESTYQFLDAFIGEMSELFPDPYFHIGGDEVTGKQWMSPRIRAFMRKNRLKTADDLQAYFNRRLQKIVAQHGKRMEGWDEILNPDLPKDIVIQSWRGQKSLAEAARHGFSGVLSNGYYLDHMEPASKLYGVDPMAGDAGSLSAEEQARILGGEVAMWGEFVEPNNVDSRIWPRAAAVAERLWSPREITDVASMYRRLDVIGSELEQRGLKLHNDPVPEPLKTLADILEPATFGQRIRTHKYNQQTPLNQLVDRIPPESATAREFAGLVDGRNRAEMRAWLVRWRDNRANFEPLTSDLSKAAGIGLAALDSLDRGERPPDGWVAQQRAFLESLKKPQREFRLAIAPSIERLLAMAASQPSGNSAPDQPKHD
ncbi:MAG TPA: family 20 glycosylhydrolase [Bryobacteraceae bacterium]|nr:family 20 glycosylhydrolase [Bryobacteraceae bacterium]